MQQATTPPPPLRVEGSGKGEKIADYDTRSKPVESREAYNVGRFRRIAGYILGFFIIVVTGSFFFWSLDHLNRIPLPLEPQQEKFLLAKLSTHGVITIAFVFFAYTVLRAAERMMLPHWWDVEFTKLMLGIRHPLQETLKFAERLGLQLPRPKGE